MSIENPRFSSTLDQTLQNIKGSRMDVLKNTENLPPSILFGREIRNTLKETTEEKKEGRFNAPQELHNVNGFFDLVHQTISERWEQKAKGQIEEKCQEWIQQLQKDDKADYSEIITILSDPDAIQEKIFQHRLRVLAPLREALPKAWETLTVLSSEYQLANVALSRRWLKKMPDSAFDGMDFNRDELLLQNDLAGLVGKLIDHGYIKQDQLDKAISAEESEGDDGGGQVGRKYIYSLPTESGQNTLTSFNQVLPFELHLFIADLNALAEKTEDLLSNKRLPDSYHRLPAYLRLMAETYGSNETDQTKLYAQWQKLYQTNVELLKSGCPLVINPQEDDPFTVVGMEVRLGLRSKELQSMEKTISLHTDKSYQMMEQLYSENTNSTIASPQKTDIFLSNQTFAFGPNLQSATNAESYHGQMFVHANAVESDARKSELPILKKIMQRDIDDAEYVKYAILETARHETAHAILPREDEAVMKRIGESNETHIIEELKAETVGMKLATVEKEQKNLSKKEIEMTFFAKLGTLLDYLKTEPSEEGAEGEDYYLCGVKIITELLDKGNIKMENGKLTIINAEDGMANVAKIGDEILDIYKNMETKTGDIKLYVKKIRDLKNNNQLKEVLKSLS